MPDFDPFSDEGKEWLENHTVEDQYNSLENMGNSILKKHTSHKLQHVKSQSIEQKEGANKKPIKQIRIKFVNN
jgi:hypothetical protein